MKPGRLGNGISVSLRVPTEINSNLNHFLSMFHRGQREKNIFFYNNFSGLVK